MRSLSDTTKRWLARVVFTASATMLVGSIPVNALLLSRSLSVGNLWSLQFLALPVVGFLIARRQPNNPIAWILLAVGAVIGLGSVAEPYSTYGVALHPGSLPAAATVAAVNGALWVPAIGVTGTYLILLFPDGRLPSPKWRPVAWLSGVTMSLLVIAFVFSPGTLEQNSAISNPLGIDILEPVLPIALLVIPVLPLCMLASAAGLVARFRRSQGVERLQVKWLTTAAAIVASVYLVMMLISWLYGLGNGPEPGWLQTLSDLAIATFVLIPLSIGVAVLRHGLYGIDRLISRTVSYGLLSGTLLMVYLGIVTLLSQLPSSSGSLSVAASTLTVAALFQPLRSKVQTLVDRRFNRARYDADRTVEGFARRLRDEVDLDAVRTDLMTVVRETLQPANTGLWLRDPR